MQRFYLHTFLGFAAWITLSLTLHYFSASPWGGPLVLDPDRMLPDALFLQWGVLGFFCLFFAGIDHLFRRSKIRSGWRILTLVFFVIYCLFTQLDLELQRWLGQHVTLSFIKTYKSAADNSLTWKMYASDAVWTGIAITLILITPIPAVYAWRKRHQESPLLGWKFLLVAFTLSTALITAHKWFRPNPRRWRNIRPAWISISYDAYAEALKRNRPRDVPRAHSDLTGLLKGDWTLQTVPQSPPTPATYPLWRNDNIGELDAETFKALPLEERPDIVLIVFESWRGWNTGLAPNKSLKEGSPQINKLLRDEGLYFPYTHSVGFPSSEGSIGLHLGLLSHPSKIFLAEYVLINSLSFPEILRDYGYYAFSMFGEDPSFSNFTPWFNRWYDDIEFNKHIRQDGPLVDKFIERYEEKRGKEPRLMMLRTATTHPPYRVPDSEGIEIAKTSEGRFDQAIRYSDKHLARLIHYLKEQPEWDRTVVIILGDHAQPTPDQWRLSDTIGSFTPGHTWTALGFLGGWKGLKERGRYDFDVLHTDIAPTLLSMLNIRADNHFMGDDLRKVIQAAQSDDPNEQRYATQRPLTMLHNGDIALQRDQERLLFRLDNSSTLHIGFNRKDTLQYGLLQADGLTIDDELPQEYPVDRWRDAIRAYGTLLDDNRLMPPPKEQEP